MTVQIFWLELTPRRQPGVCARSEVEVGGKSIAMSNALCHKVCVEWHNVGGVPIQKCQITVVQKHHNL